MKIALISPKGPLYRHRGGIFRKDLRAAPLTLTTLAALVPEDINAEVAIYDEGIEDIPIHFEADIVGMTVITGSATRAYELAAKFRQEKKTVVLGGPHVTLLPEEAQQHADVIVQGYAEETWPQLLSDYSNGTLQKNYKMSADFSLQKTANLPFAKRDMLPKKSYKTIHTYEATRACIHNCEFCVVPTAWGRKPLQKPVGHIVEDIRRTGSSTVLFYDLNLIANKNYAKELFRALLPLKINWVGLATTMVDKDPELLDLLHRSGCKGLLIGFESMSEATLAKTNKSFNHPLAYKELLRKLHSLGIVINGTFVFGNDEDTSDSFAQVRDFVLQTNMGLPRFSILTPFPNTPLFRRLEKDGRILHRNWSQYDGQHLVFQPKRMTAQELLEGHEGVWQEVYSYRGIWRRISRNISYLLPIVLASNMAYRFYARNLAKFYTCRGGFV
ncbi:MAG: radical SAM protein [Spirochaetota bacterium]